jgi:hypothetical protein
MRIFYVMKFWQQSWWRCQCSGMRLHVDCYRVTIQLYGGGAASFQGKSVKVDFSGQILCFVDRSSLYSLVNKTNLVHNLFLVYLSISTCFGRLWACHQEKQLCLCDTWYLLFCVDDCLVCRVEFYGHIDDEASCSSAILVRVYQSTRSRPMKPGSSNYNVMTWSKADRKHICLADPTVINTVTVTDKLSLCKVMLTEFEFVSEAHRIVQADTKCF